MAYGLLSVLLAGGYAAVVLGLGQLLGHDFSLVVAAAFQPARRRIQALVDRRFNRRRHDAARTIATFSARRRDQVDLDTLTADLLAVVDQTMQPTRGVAVAATSRSGHRTRRDGGSPMTQQEMNGIRSHGQLQLDDHCPVHHRRRTRVRR